MQKTEQFVEGINLLRKHHCGLILLLWSTALLSGGVCAAQQPDAPAPQPEAMAKQKQATSATAAAPGAPLRLTLQDALALARKNEPTYQSVVTAAGVAGETRAQTRDALLPSVNFNTSALYTQSSHNGTNGVIFIANNSVHEYISQGNVHQQLDLASWETYRSAAALASAAKARAEVAARGLVVTVVLNYFAAAGRGEKPRIREPHRRCRRKVSATHPGPRKGRGSGPFRRHQGRLASSGTPSPTSGSETGAIERKLGPRRPPLPGFQRSF